MNDAVRVSGAPLQTPVLMIIFNRPRTTKLVFEEIRKVRPSRFYIAADGPRKNVSGEEQKCIEARKIIESIDWECEVHTLFRDENLGCGKGPSTAITWFFEHETEGIILEDDCLPSGSFFTFCSELLERYRNDTRVMQIGGNNREQVHSRETNYSYRFSNQEYIWGWATWRRAWKYYDFHMNLYKEVREKGYLEPYFKSIYQRDFYRYVFQRMYQGDDQLSSKTIWDYQWQFTLMIQSGRVIVPSRNLVCNLGFGIDATNTRNPVDVGYDLKLETMEFPLRHPEFMMVDEEKDRYVFNSICTSSISRVKSRIKNLIPARILAIILNH